MNIPLLLDKKAVRNSFAMAVGSYDNAATLQRRVGERLYANMGQHLLGQSTVLDIGCGTGFLTEKLSIDSRQLIALDIALPMLHKTRTGLLAYSHIDYLCADAETLPLRDDSIDCIVANLSLQWCQNLNWVVTEFQRVLTAKGSILFSIFGHDTLKELKTAWSKVDHYPHVNHFYTGIEIQQILALAGFKKVQLQIETTVLNYPDVQSLMRELKDIGAHNVNQGRFNALTSKSRMQKMLDSYEALRCEGLIPSTYEIIYVKGYVGV